VSFVVQGFLFVTKPSHCLILGLLYLIVAAVENEEFAAAGFSAATWEND